MQYYHKKYGEKAANKDTLITVYALIMVSLKLSQLKKTPKTSDPISHRSIKIFVFEIKTNNR